MNLRWIRDRKRRLAHSRRRIAEHEHVERRLDEQEPRVKELAAFARKQVEQNHLTQLFLAIHRERG